MQVTKITGSEVAPAASKREPVTTETLQREFDYYRSVRLLQKLLQAGLILQEEFDKIDHLNRSSFSPFGFEIMP